MSGHSAAAERNKEPILGVLANLLAPHERVLELASGTGQHVVHFARQLPLIEFQPTEKDTTGLAELVVALVGAGLPNIRPPLVLDVLSDWPAVDPVDLVLCINMIHIAPWPATSALFAGAKRVLRPNSAGRVLLYGPFREEGVHTAPSNEEFDAWLKRRDLRSGVRDLGEVTAVASSVGFERKSVIRMPANNLCVSFQLT